MINNYYATTVKLWLNSIKVIYIYMFMNYFYKYFDRTEFKFTSRDSLSTLNLWYTWAPWCAFKFCPSEIHHNSIKSIQCVTIFTSGIQMKMDFLKNIWTKQNMISVNSRAQFMKLHEWRNPKNAFLQPTAVVGLFT